ncbi:MAG TPA: iron-containing alcohol dehydrogenase [Candidatus Hydrogenedentes bacterium]|nr:iron-containing alcohol dehydrogenase [Candidatus Hydrogenedentota bacterium]
MKIAPLPLPMPRDTRFGKGASKLLLPLCAAFGTKGLVVHSASVKKNGRLEALLSEKPGETDCWQHEGGEPALVQTEALRRYIQNTAPHWVAAIGGGSVLDLARAAAGLSQAPLSVQEYHDGAEIPESPLPFIAVPTTAGTGSEATTVSVLTNRATGVKKSIRHPSFMARLVLLDPELMTGTPASVLAASGMDALTQAIEAFCSRGATCLTDALAKDAAEKVFNALPGACSGDPSFFDDMMLGSYMAGLALASARLGLVHGLAHPLGARYHAAHGLVCAFCLPPVLAFNRPVIPEKYDTLKRIFRRDPLEAIAALIQKLPLASPFTGQVLSDTQAIIEETLASGSTKANPRDVSADQVQALLNHLFQ